VIRLVLAEDSFLVRDGVLRLLAAQPDVDVVGVGADYDEALAAIEDHHPDVLLTDIRMPPTRTGEGIRLAEYCRRVYPRTGVLLLSQYVEPSYVKALLNQGTDGRGYLLKERVASADDLVDAIRAVAAGDSAIDPKVVESLVQGRTRAGDARIGRLSPREREVLEAIAQGHTNAAVAAALVLSPKAVEKHINSIFAKLGLTGDQEHHPRVRATLMYLSEGRQNPA
jgi:DNA-binding NarL/FixJ family response regulator